MTDAPNAATQEKIASEYWQEGPGRSAALFAAKCDQCGTCYLPKVMVCTNCGGRKFAASRLGETGRLYVHTVIQVAAAGYPSPYSVGYVDFGEGVRVFGHVRLDGEVAPTPDCTVAVEVAELFSRANGQKVIGYRFVPVASRESAR